MNTCGNCKFRLYTDKYRVIDNLLVHCLWDCQRPPYDSAVLKFIHTVDDPACEKWIAKAEDRDA
jgi:hypothetical protein